MRKEKRAQISNWGDRLTILNNNQAKAFLKKYEKDIKREARKRSFLPGIGIDDLIQECKISLLEHYHEFTSKKSQERTWAMRIITTTLNRIWNTALKQVRTCYVPGELGEKPIYNLPFDTIYIDGKNASSLESSYIESPDGRPVFGTHSSSPEENCEIFLLLSFIKEKLPEEIFLFIKEKILYSDNSNTKKKKAVPEKQLKTIADFFIKELHFSKTDIATREKMINIVF